MARTYYSTILTWDWDVMVRLTRQHANEHVEPRFASNGASVCDESCDEEGHVGSCYLGSVMALTPSGKFYMPWTTNQTARDVDRDSRWYAALDKAATKYDGWIESGEGDPTDLYFCRYWAE